MGGRRVGESAFRGHTILQAPGLAADPYCPRPGGWKFKVMVSAGLSPWRIDGHLLPASPHSLPCVCPHLPFVQNPSHVGRGPTLLTAFNLNDLFTDPVSKHSHPEGLGLGLERTKV